MTDGSTPRPDRTTAPEGGSRRGRVLVAEDDPVLQIVTVSTLTILGYEVEVVPNGREAVHAVRRGCYVGVFMDCQMPEMDGYQATAEIRRQEAGLRHIPIIALTATPTGAGREKCLAAGMDDYLTKPATQGQMEAVLQRWGRSEV